MNADRFQKVKEIFSGALEQAPENRAAFLLDQCGGDIDLRSEVESLLSAHSVAENVIETNALNLRDRLSSNGKNYRGKDFGHYRILKEIGAGGMGAVFLAERNDKEFDQQVALKIVNQTIISGELERHFRRERQILASLNHPNIARLLDGGVSQNGEPFLAMEYVEGDDLLKFSRDLSIPGKLEVFLKVCAAVEYAHRNLIVHRDLKPSNIIVSPDGEPKLLDFGVARIEDESFSGDSTRTSFRALTPAYASPEQLRGDKVTTSSDIYSLGVVLYELLSGVKPFNFENKDLSEILRTITDDEPRPMSETGDRNLQARGPGGDLENIVAMALRKEPARRYRSVAAFADDIERYLNGLPITASPNTLTYRASKYFQRNKIAVSAAALITIALFLGLSVALWQAGVARRERDRAEKRFEDVRKLSNSLLFEITPKIENLNGSTEAREILVKRALEYLDSLANESRDDLQLQSELAGAYEKIGDLQGNPGKPNLSDFTGAAASYQKAIDIRRILPESIENSSLLARNFIQLSTVRYILNDVSGAIDASRESLTIYERLTATSDAYELKIDHLDAQINNAQIYSDNNQYKTAIPLFEKTLDALKTNDGGNKDIQRLTVKAETLYANALSWDGRQEEAEASVTGTIERSEKLLAAYSNDSGIRQQAWRTYSTTSSIYEGTNNPLSLEFAEKALKLAQVGVSIDSADTQAKQNLAKTYSRAGICAVLTGKLPQARDYFKNSERISLELVEKEPNNVFYKKDFGRLYIRIGDYYRKVSDLTKALDSYERSASYFEALASDDKNTLVQRDLAQSLKNVGEIRYKLNQPTEAKQAFHRAFEILTALKSRNALGEFDGKMIDEIEVVLGKLSSPA